VPGESRGCAGVANTKKKGANGGNMVSPVSTQLFLELGDLVLGQREPGEPSHVEHFISCNRHPFNPSRSRKTILGIATIRRRSRAVPGESRRAARDAPNAKKGANGGNMVSPV
jgi:hypothetical protein